MKKFVMGFVSAAVLLLLVSPAYCLDRLSTDRLDYLPGQFVGISFEGVSAEETGDGAWVTISPSQAAADSYGDWKYLSEGSGRLWLEVPEETGSYEVRAYLGKSATEENLAREWTIPVSVSGARPDDEIVVYPTANDFDWDLLEFTPGSRSWTGTYDTNFKTLYLQQSGDTVTGSYPEWDDGRVDGITADGIFYGYWYESPTYAPHSDAGQLVLALYPDGQGFQGWWRYGNNGSWRDWSSGVFKAQEASDSAIDTGMINLQNLSVDEMNALAQSMSTQDHALATEFEWALDYVRAGEGTSSKVITDPGMAEQILGERQALLNGGWKAFMFTEDGVYGSDVERYFHVQITASGVSFLITTNWKYLFDPNAGGSIEESGSDTFGGSFDAQTGTATALTSYARIDFDAFYLSKDASREYAIGNFYWNSGEIDRIALMRSAAGYPGGVVGLSPGNIQESEQGNDSGTSQGNIPGNSQDNSAGNYPGAGAEGLAPDPIQNISMEDFNWYYYSGFPYDAAAITELQDLGGSWKSLVRVQTPVDGVEQCRILLSKLEIQYMGFRVTTLLDVKKRYSYPAANPAAIEEVPTEEGIILTYEGDWDDSSGSIEVSSLNTSLCLDLTHFAEKDGTQYAWGTVYDGEYPIGEILLVR